jgi:TetR/AcrR family transcriptional regulator, lmrAB and yxaGH operons repressor
MAEAQAPKGSMYFHFPGGKEELAAAAVDYFAERVMRRMETGLEEAATVGEAVTGFFDGYIEHFRRTDFAEGCAVATVVLDAASQHEALANATGRALRGWVDRFAEALEAEGRSPAEAHALATVIVAAIEGTVVLGKGERSTEPFIAVQAVLQDLLAPADAMAAAT